MNIRLVIVTLLGFQFIQPLIAHSQDLKTAVEEKPAKEEIVFALKKFYFSNDFDGAIISSAVSEALPLAPNVGTPRFTYFFNTGFNVNFDLSKNIGIFSGLGIKNIGFIEKSAIIDSTIKRRSYNIGVPLGIKVGNLRKKNYFMLGGGIDFPFNYREKGFVRRGNKEKFNEWFSDRTPRYMPYVFAGFSVKPGFYMKFQYYPGNFMNADYTMAPGSSGIIIKPYAAYNVQVFMVSLGFDIRYSNKMKITRKPGDQVM